MKSKLAAIALLLLTVMAPAREITFEWDPNTEPDIAGYYLEVSTDAGQTWEAKPSVIHPVTEQKLQLPNVRLMVRAFAVNAAGKVSDPSEITLTVEADKPGAPKGLRTIRVVFESSRDLKSWQEVASTHASIGLGSAFFRTILHRD